MIDAQGWREIQHLHARFDRSLDSGDFDALGEIFTADVEYTSSGVTRHGVDALIDSFRARRTGPRTTRHLSGTPVILDNREDSLETVLVCVSWAAHTEEVAPHAEVYMVADFHDTYRETALGWRISSRRIVPVFRNADLAPTAAAASGPPASDHA